MDTATKQNNVTERKIITHYLNPPIPLRYMDWVAYYQGSEEDGICGYGRTEDAAIEDLKIRTNED